MLVDSHCHLDFKDFEGELDNVVARAGDAGVGTMVSISTHLSKFDGVKAVAERFNNVWCTVGVHPHQAGEEGVDTRASASPASTIFMTAARVIASRLAFARISPLPAKPACR